MILWTPQSGRAAWLFVALLMVAMPTLFSQSRQLEKQDYFPGRIMKRDGSEQKAWIRYQDHRYNSKNCRYVLSENEASQSYTPAEIGGY